MTPVDYEYDIPSPAADQAEWCGGEIVWEVEDLAVIRAVYEGGSVMSKVIYEKRDRIAFLTINRPEARNAIDPESTG